MIGCVIRLKVPHLSQKMHHFNCGPICLSMVLSFFKKSKITREKYEEILLMTMRGNPELSCGTAPQTMKSAVIELGLKYRNIHGIEQLTLALKRKHPVIVRCLIRDEYDDPYRHYIVVCGKDDSNLFINDPYVQKPGKVKIRQFMARAQKLNWGNKKWGMAVYERS